MLINWLIFLLFRKFASQTNKFLAPFETSVKNVERDETEVLPESEQVFIKFVFHCLFNEKLFIVYKLFDLNYWK